MKIYLYRHGMTRFNAERRYQGRGTDAPLSEHGKAALREQPFSPALVFVSPQLRARQTAALLFPGAEQQVVEEFAEMDFGAFEGRSWIEMEHDAAYRAWVAGGCEGRCPGGEDKAGFCRRVCGAFEALLSRLAPDENASTAIVAHGGTLQAVMERYALPERGFFDWRPPLGGGYALDWDKALWQERRKLRLAEELRC